MKVKDKIINLFGCDDVGEKKEYVGCMVEHEKNKCQLKMTQLVMIHLGTKLFKKYILVQNICIEIQKFAIYIQNF